MQKLSFRLSQELIENGNLPVSPEGIVRLRPDIASEVEAARLLLQEDAELDSQDVDGWQSESSEEELLLARFLAVSEGTEQRHLFILESPGSVSSGYRIRRWSKMPVSYGSFVQIRKFLSDAWGEIRDLEVQSSRLSVIHEP